MKIIILTGAGISAESGIKTFRDSNGLWENHSIEEVATPEGYKRNPELVLNFYNQRRQQLREPQIAPNAAHKALAQLEARHQVIVVTQNVDNLHERGGSQNVLHIHGELMKMRCTNSGKVFSVDEDISTASICECCKAPGNLRPDIVWFGEMPYHLDQVYHDLEKCDLFISIGTSGQVYPAASFVNVVRAACLKIEVNTEATSEGVFDRYLIGKASISVPKLVDQILRAERANDLAHWDGFQSPH